MKFAAIDPGVRGVGAAVFNAGRLSWAGYLRNPVKAGNGPTAWAGYREAVAHLALFGVPEGFGAIVVEVPQVYGGARGRKGDPNDLIDLAGIDGLIVGALSAVQTPRPQAVGLKPREWTRGQPYEGRELVIRGSLGSDEAGRVEWPAQSLAHNVVDAIGIGLHFAKQKGERQ